MSDLSSNSSPIWHPFTSLNDPDLPILISSGKGSKLYTKDGREIIDAISSWWVNIHGHCNEKIADAIALQAKTLEHVIFAGFSHEPAEELAKNLIGILPGEFSKIFFSDNGSTAVEVALKLALQFWHNLGHPKKKIVAIDGAYHGDTFGAMSVASRSPFTAPFFPFLFDVEFIDFPLKDKEHTVLENFINKIKNNDVAAFIYEPLLQGAAGMRTYSAEILAKLLSEAKNHEVLCIADEVLTGFGRTGKLFASEYISLPPDIIAVSKGITGGFLPLGITCCNEKVTSAFRSTKKEKTFYHGHSYTGNPLSCAAANASMKLIKEPLFFENIKRIEKAHSEFYNFLSGKKGYRKINMLGTMISIEIAVPEKSSYFNPSRDFLYRYFIDRNILMRPLGNTIYILPPYVITNEELSKIYDAISELLDTLL